jgi:sugar lactone lactonase YvrE
MVISRWVPVVVAVIAAAACGGSTKVPDGPDGAAPPADTGAPPPDAPSPDVAPTPACPAAGANGNLVIAFTGLPAGAAGHALVAPAGSGSSPVTVTKNETRSVAPGLYGVEARQVAVPDPLVRSAYRPTEVMVTTCVRAGESTTVTIGYALIASSGKLWAGNALEAATGSPAATVAAKTGGSDGFTFDRAGNLWVLGGTTADAPLARYAAATLGASGEKTPDVTIDSPSFGGGLPGAKVVAFDKKGNLWVSVVWADKVVSFRPDQLAASGKPTASTEVTGIEGPRGIAFDAAGNMFVASGANKVVRFDAARLTASTTMPDLEIAGQTPPPVTVNLQDPQGLAFDKEGNLWVAFGGTLVRLPPTDLAGVGMKMLTPAIQIETDVLALPLGLAFDEGGGLWVAYSKGKFVRLGADQLGSSGKVRPAVVITGPDVGYAGWFALYPGGTGLPLYHSWP